MFGGKISYPETAKDLQYVPPTTMTINMNGKPISTVKTQSTRPETTTEQWLHNSYGHHIVKKPEQTLGTITIKATS